MSDGIKWAALLAGLVLIVGLIVALPLSEAIDFGAFTSALDTIISIISKPLYYGRSLVNNFLTPVGRSILSGVIFYIFFKWAFTTGWKAIAGVYHWIFK